MANESLSVLLFVAICVSLFPAAMSYNRLTDVWNYVAVVKPELYLVKQVGDVVKEKANTTSSCNK